VRVALHMRRTREQSRDKSRCSASTVDLDPREKGQECLLAHDALACKSVVAAVARTEPRSTAKRSAGVVLSDEGRQD
jgi:hypothetical protein